jgi:hypothetical protein
MPKNVFSRKYILKMIYLKTFFNKLFYEVKGVKNQKILKEPNYLTMFDLITFERILDF